MHLLQITPNNQNPHQVAKCESKPNPNREWNHEASNGLECWLRPHGTGMRMKVAAGVAAACPWVPGVPEQSSSYLELLHGCGELSHLR